MLYRAVMTSNSISSTVDREFFLSSFFFHVKNVHAFKFSPCGAGTCSNHSLEKICAFNLCRPSNWRKICNCKNFQSTVPSSSHQDAAIADNLLCSKHFGWTALYDSLCTMLQHNMVKKLGENVFFVAKLCQINESIQCY